MDHVGPSFRPAQSPAWNSAARRQLLGRGGPSEFAEEDLVSRMFSMQTTGGPYASVDGRADKVLEGILGEYILLFIPLMCMGHVLVRVVKKRRYRKVFPTLLKRK